MHNNSTLLFKKYAREHFRPGDRVLEIGPDRLPSTYASFVSAPLACWDTLDLAAREDIAPTYTTSDEYAFPVEEDAYDVVFAAQVIEHVRKIWRWMPELARICRPGGRVVIINPVSWHYHEAPVDCWRIYPEGMRALCEDAGLRVVLSRCENVQMAGLEARSPSLIRKQRVFERLSGVLGMMNAVVRFPIEGAYDTITVAEKPMV